MTVPVAARAIVLAGGRSSRLGGTPKALFRAGAGAPTLVEAAVNDLLSLGVDAGEVVVVGPPSLPRMPVRVTREQPPFSGPAAGIAAGLASLADAGASAPWTLLLACDMPGAREAVSALLAAASGAEPGTRGIVVNDDGRLQPLAGIYRTPELETAVEGQATVDRSVRSLVGALWDRQLELSGATDDVDTWDDVERFGLIPGAHP
ncbi:molybdopterin-guanine dinucleotide biosynthesis protein A [Kocuria coralli]|uniref:Molybdopterin-guanine dinucleotide biosynthesis protein A n=1 Tax=Kocuria coralli TaxID=1461025 RepID=A0A5J5KZQ8_9MICC|nr:NTP transferase domain-containing protein [Kocuria coralli]KAA9394191.1 molybdopterin-guanine dinucleotide biosynthesis protein A [Kocuria coralli]